MFRMINRTTMLFGGVFLIACLVALVYHVFFVWPQQECDQRGAWWDSKDRQCLTPLPIWRLTGRELKPAAQAQPPAVSATKPTAAKK
ncbi:hypothetical protein ACO2Q3_18375 [Caulobacter sp. KR2-114]|uniref:hypothetical protein n=1 Tax=Caulobacter sp. KR2-114 TaxID=3400912 RepID=UPI003C01CCCD